MFFLNKSNYNNTMTQIQPNYNNTMTQQNKELIIKRKLTISYPIKPNYNTVIPLNIFQTWHTKKLPPLMKQNVDYIKKSNPAFTYTLFDDEDCYKFIKNNYTKDVADAFNNLVPGAYKADLWRYCVLYKLGGIYLDIKYRPVQGFKFINLTEKEHWVLDANGHGIYNALMVCKPDNPILLKAINQIVINVKTKYYGNNDLEPTGPNLLAKYFNDSQKQSFDMKHTYFKNVSNRFIYFNDYIIFNSYNGYITEHTLNKKVPHYADLWRQKYIYK
jgi:mannosyltransferase OCH1-like enzyme